MIERKVSPMPVLTCALVLIFGGLTLWLSNENFIKIKPTILYAMFAAVLVGGLAFNRLFIKYLLGQTLQLADPAWRALTWRWSLFFLALAIVNEFVWRNDIDGHVGRVQSVGRVPADAALCAVADAVHRAPSNRRRQDRRLRSEGCDKSGHRRRRIGQRYCAAFAILRENRGPV